MLWKVHVKVLSNLFIFVYTCVFITWGGGKIYRHSLHLQEVYAYLHIHHNVAEHL